MNKDATRERRTFLKTGGATAAALLGPSAVAILASKTEQRTRDTSMRMLEGSRG